ADFAYRCHRGVNASSPLHSLPMPTLTRLTATDLVAVMNGFRDALRDHRERVNRLNVYPVPDGDTGTNMSLTLDSVCRDLEGVKPDDMAAVCQAVSHGALMGAR